MRTARLLGLLTVFWAAIGLTQTTDDLLNDGRNTENVLTQSMGYDRKSYSPLKQIDKSTVKRLVPIWSTSLMNDQGELSAPTIYNGVMYVVNGKWTFAIDVETGRQIWRTPVRLEQGITRSAFHRGAATIYKGKIFRVTIDNHILALDMKTGEELWNQKFADLHDGYYATIPLRCCVAMSSAHSSAFGFAGFVSVTVWPMTPECSARRHTRRSGLRDAYAEKAREQIQPADKV